jgi:hypothetical protein
MNKKRDSEGISEAREEKGKLRDFDKSAMPNMHFQHAPIIPSPTEAAISMLETDFLESLPDPGFGEETSDFTAKGNHVVEQWECRGILGDQAFFGCFQAPLPSSSTGKIRFKGPTLGNAGDGETAENIELDDLLLAIRQLRFFNGI